jgi:hypothetical protein
MEGQEIGQWRATMKTVLIILIIFVSSVCFGEIYKWVDEKGTVHFTEDPATIPEKYRDKAKSRRSDEDLRIEGKKGGKEVSIENVFTFPEKYVQKKLVFSGCKVNQDIWKADSVLKGGYSIGITSRGGKYVSPIVKRDGITFILLDSLAEEMAGDIQGGYDWFDCDVYCTVLFLSGFHVAVIARIDIRNMGGKIAKRYIDKILWKRSVQ